MIDFLALALLVPMFGLHDGEGADADPAAQESVLETYDLSGMLPRLDSDNWQQTLVVEPAGGRNDLGHVRLHELYAEPSPDVVLDLLTQVLGDELRYEGREIALESNGRLVLLAPAPIQARVRQVLADLRRALFSSTTVRVDLLDLPAGLPVGESDAGVIEASAADRLVSGLVARGGEHRRLAFRIEPGRTASLDQTDTVPFLFDYDLEIAQGAFAFDPVMVSARSGARFLLRGVPVGGGIHLSMLYASSETVGEIENMSIGLGGLIGQEGGGVEFVEGPKVIQTAEVLVRSLAFETFLADGKALVLNADTNFGDGDRRQVLVLRKVGGSGSAFQAISVAGTQRKVLVVNAEAFRPPSFLLTAQPRVRDDEELDHPAVQAELELAPSNFLFDWLQYRFSVWRHLGPWALVVTDPAWDGEAAGALEKLIARSRIDEEIGVVDIQLRRRGGEAPPMVRWSVPARRRGGLGVVLGRTGTAVIDYDVEVAQFSSASDPIVTPTFSGLAAVLEIGSVDEQLVIDTHGSARFTEADPRAIAPADSKIGRLDQLKVSRLEFDERLALEPNPQGGFGAVVGGRSAKGDEGGLSLEISVRP